MLHASRRKTGVLFGSEPKPGAARLRLIILLAACAAAGCSASTSSRAPQNAEPCAAPPDSVRRVHADVDLTGTWATGSTGEPAARRVAIAVECNYTPSLWVLQQNGDTVRLWVIAESRSQGVRSKQIVSNIPAARGFVSGVDLTMGAVGTRYALRYDSTSGHLRGTLNDAPFWAVRQQIVRPAQCIAVP
ncbi:MAG TPA: hypothetical protein VGL17_01450 [Gemmatimonadaceae bacterium]